MKVFKEKHFTNGSVFGIHLTDGFKIEVTDTFLPYETKFCVNGTNQLTSTNPGSRLERWMVGVSCMSGCPVGCRFCATGQLQNWRNLSEKEMVNQVMFVLVRNNSIDPNHSKEFKINWTRMGEPFLNIKEIRTAMETISAVVPDTHHYISTIGIKNSDFSWIEGNTTLQISLHSLDEKRRHELIPFGNALMSIEELGRIRTRSSQKTTINLTLVDMADFDIEKLKKNFDPEFFFIKLSPINPNPVSLSNGMDTGLLGNSTHNLV